MQLETVGRGVELPSAKLLEIARIKEAPYNPVRRTQRRSIKPLVESIKRVGLLYPILVDQGNKLIEGHRRLAAARELGWEFIPALVVTVADRDAVYAEVNANSARMSGSDSLSVWLVRKGAVGPRQAKLFTEMEAVLGRPLVKEMVETGLSSRVYQTARRVARYVGDETDLYVQSVLKWLMRVAVIGQVMKALEAGIPAATLSRAVRSMKPLKISTTEELN